ncbi:FecR family protein [Pedobacter helvus]|uniref:FecR family protein n=1 Tax=Pedobacter helvus TaxID=2563444 RepID=A0ABW9JP22_9SPHI|nr:FecR family protein [Pedobacter ureilyticus]
MSDEKLYQLLREYFGNTISATDCAELLKYLDEGDKEVTSLAIDEVLQEFKNGPIYSEEQSKKVFNRILTDDRFVKHKVKPIVSIKLKWLQYAAAFILIPLAVTYFVLSYHSKNMVEKVNNIANVKMPTTDTTKVILSTSKGMSIALDSNNKQGGLIDLGGNAITNQASERMLAYENKNSWIAKEAVFHTLSVPRGTNYSVHLPDGTKVWLNSATSLTYPSAFLGKERKVILSGEAYFEVAKNQQKPFVIEANGSAVQVLGTHFNVSSYKDDDDVTTTLLEGSVKVFNKHNSVVLSPGKQAIVAAENKIIDIKTANTEEVMAWKNGYFVFADADMKSIMKDLARWYNIDVEFRGEVAKQYFGGTFSKKKSLEELLENLEDLGNIQFKIEGRRVIVMP